MLKKLLITIEIIIVRKENVSVETKVTVDFFGFFCLLIRLYAMYVNTCHFSAVIMQFSAFMACFL